MPNTLFENVQTEKKSGRTRRIKALIKKEMFQIIKDPSTLLISIVLPIILLFLYGYGVSLDLDRLLIASCCSQLEKALST